MKGLSKLTFTCLLALLLTRQKTKPPTGMAGIA